MPDTRTSLQVLLDVEESVKALIAMLKARPEPVGNMLVASDAELDGKYGNPVIKAKSPRDWTGEDQTGKLLSECPPDYLSMCAERLDYFAEKNDTEGTKANNGKPMSAYNRRDAKLYRGWAARLRSGWKPATSPMASTPEPFGEQEIPW